MPTELEEIYLGFTWSDHQDDSDLWRVGPNYTLLINGRQKE